MRKNAVKHICLTICLAICLAIVSLLSRHGSTRCGAQAREATALASKLWKCDDLTISRSGPPGPGP